MAAPPPPPPPPPAPSFTLNARSGTAPLQPKNSDRSKLLSEIQTGLKLRKTVTNDRSAPMVQVKVGGLSETSAGNFSVGTPKLHAAGGVGGLFVNGIPKKPSDNKKNQANIIRGAKTSPQLLPKPSDTPSAKPLVHSESMKQQSSTPKVKHVIASGIQRQTSGTVADRLEQFNQISRPGLAPPTPPSCKAKPAVKDVLVPMKQTSISEQFKTLRPNRTNGDMPLRRSGSSDDLRNASLTSEKRTTPPPLPTNPPSSSRIAKPACPPPPPPTQPSRIGRSVPATYAFNQISQLTPDSSTSTLPLLSSVGAGDDDSPPPPPPPPRITSCADQMDRFTFIPINELPPPGVFSGFQKTYEYHPQRKIQNTPQAFH